MRNNRLNLRHALLLVLLILSTFSLSADAATWFVDQSNTGTEDGASWGTAYTTIQPAIDAAFADGGGDVWGARGTFTRAYFSEPKKAKRVSCSLFDSLDSRPSGMREDSMSATDFRSFLK